MRALGVFLVFVSSYAWSAPRDAFQHALPGQELIFEAGRSLVLSEGAAASVALTFDPIDKRHVWIGIAVLNTGGASFVIDEESVDAMMPGDSNEVSIVGVADLEKREKRRRFWEGLATGLAAGANSYSAGQQGRGTAVTSHSGSVNAYGSGGNVRGTYSGTSVTTYTDPAAAQAAQREARAANDAMLSRMKEAQSERADNLTSNALLAQTVRPGDKYGGRVQLRLPKARDDASLIVITVNAGGEEHPFVLFTDARPSATAVNQVNASLASFVPTPRYVAESPSSASEPALEEQAPDHAEIAIPTPVAAATPRASAPVSDGAMSANSGNTSTSVTRPDSPQQLATAAPASSPSPSLPATPSGVQRDPYVVELERQLRQADANGGFYLIDKQVARRDGTNTEWRLPPPTARDWFSARWLCSEMGEGWRLPTSAELKLLGTPQVRTACGALTCNLPPLFGEFRSDGFWSSEELDSQSARMVRFSGTPRDATESKGAKASAICTRRIGARG